MIYVIILRNMKSKKKNKIRKSQYKLQKLSFSKRSSRLGADIINFKANCLRTVIRDVKKIH